MPSLQQPRPITELEAVNIMLRAIGEDPVMNIGANAKPTALKAKEMLSEECVNLQAGEYNFCSSKELRLTPDLNGEVRRPDNALSWQPVGRSKWMDLQDRDGKLFNAKENTFVFTSDVYISAVLSLPFEQLPHVVRWYIAMLATMRFQNSEQPDGSGLRVTAEDVRRAEVSFKRYDARLRKGGLLSHNPFFQRMRG